MAIHDDIRRRLDFIKNSKQREVNMAAPENYREFMPADLSFEPLDQSLRYATLEEADQRGVNRTNITRVKAQNERDRQEYIRRLAEKRRAEKILEAAEQPIDVGINIRPGQQGGQRNYGNYDGNRNFGKRWGKDNTPEVSDLNTLRPNAPITTINWRGRSFQVNRQVAPIFVAFLDDLWNAGYRPASIGGHNDRNIAGTNTPSLHSYGFAIDIDPMQNPVQGNDGTMQMSLPPKVRSLAAKYGLSWGGDWNSYKDPMHFSVAYGGRE